MIEEIAPVNREPLVLVIDDDPDARTMFQRALRDAGITTVGLGSGEAALAWVEMHGAPDAVHVDVLLPRMSGWRLCELLREDERTKSTPIAIVTVQVEHEAQVRAEELGAQYLSKPVRIREYVDTIKHMMPDKRSVRATPSTTSSWTYFITR
jgi:two-component system, sensor histidine kinase and response regulator